VFSGFVFSSDALDALDAKSRYFSHSVILANKAQAALAAETVFWHFWHRVTLHIHREKGALDQSPMSGSGVGKSATTGNPTRYPTTASAYNFGVDTPNVGFVGWIVGIETTAFLYFSHFSHWGILHIQKIKRLR